MKKLVILLCLVSIYPVTSHALDMAGVKEKVRPYFVQFLGAETAEKLLGEDPEEVKLPPIPKVIEDATSTAVYDRKETHVDIPEEKRASYNQAYVSEIFSAARNMKPIEMILPNG